MSNPNHGEPASAGTPVANVDPINNVMRHYTRILSDAERATLWSIKDRGLELHELIASLGSSRELSIARTKAEEAVMWAVKHLTA